MTCWVRVKLGVQVPSKNTTPYQLCALHSAFTSLGTAASDSAELPNKKALTCQLEALACSLCRRALLSNCLTKPSKLYCPCSGESSQLCNFRPSRQQHRPSGPSEPLHCGRAAQEAVKTSSCSESRPSQSNRWQWVKICTQNGNPGKWKHGLNLCCHGGFILTRSQICLPGFQFTPMAAKNEGQGNARNLPTILVASPK